MKKESVLSLLFIAAIVLAIFAGVKYQLDKEPDKVAEKQEELATLVVVVEKPEVVAPTVETVEPTVAETPTTIE